MSIRNPARRAAILAVLSLPLLSFHGCASRSFSDDGHSSHLLEAITPEDIQEFSGSAADYFYKPFPGDERDPAVILADLLEDGSTLHQAAAKTGNQFGLVASLSEDLAFGLIAAGPRYGAAEIAPARREAAVAALYRVLAAKPRMTGAWGRLVNLVEAQHEGCNDQRLLDTLFSQGVDYALKVYRLNYCKMIVVRAAREAPEASAPLRALHKAFDHFQPTSIAIAERWRQAVLDEGIGLGEQPHIDASVALVDDLVTAGLADQAGSFVAALPDDVRERVLGVAGDEAEQDALSAYIVALLATGRATEASHYLADVRRRESCDKRGFDCHIWTALRVLIEDGDAFDLLKATIAERGFGLLLEQLLIDFYESAGYPQVANYQRARLPFIVNDIRRGEDDEPAWLDSMDERFLERRNHYDKLMIAAMPGLPTSVSSTSGFSQPNTSTVFKETEIAVADGTLDACRTLGEAAAMQAIERVNIWPIRVQQCGDVLVVLGMSQSLDPVGEISGGGYWLAISNDRGRQWRQVYTGLRVYFPYVARTESEIPLLRDGLVQIHADVKELDVSSITFPPVGLRALRERPDILLTAKLSDLQRDGDGDGLADIVERRLRLDAANADFDGDGVPDGYDMQPNIAAGDLSERGTAFALVLQEVFGYESAAIVPGVTENPSTGPSLQLGGTPVLPSDTIFFNADPRLFQGQLIPFRAIVLTDAQIRELQSELGIFMPLELNNFWFSKDGRRALLQWSARWRGGVIYLEKSESGHWQKEVLSDWIT